MGAAETPFAAAVKRQQDFVTYNYVILLSLYGCGEWGLGGPHELAPLFLIIWINDMSADGTHYMATYAPI